MYNKYNAKKTIVDGITFASKKEAKRYCELKLLERAKVITNLKRQVPYIIIPKSKHGKDIKYVADFVYEENGETIIEDAKGYKTDVYLIKKRLLEEMGFEIKET